MSNEQSDINLVKKGQKIEKYGILVLVIITIAFVFWFISVSSSSSKASQDLAFNLFIGGLAYGIPVLILLSTVVHLVSQWIILKGLHSSKFFLLLPIFSVSCLFLGAWVSLNDRFRFSSFASYGLWIGIILFFIINLIYKMIISKKVNKLLNNPNR